MISKLDDDVLERVNRTTVIVVGFFSFEKDLDNSLSLEIGTLRSKGPFTLRSI